MESSGVGRISVKKEIIFIVRITRRLLVREPDRRHLGVPSYRQDLSVERDHTTSFEI
jgi:hypothetical protein